MGIFFPVARRFSQENERAHREGAHFQIVPGVVRQPSNEAGVSARPVNQSSSHLENC